MAIFTIADLHLSFNTNKPMNIFGTNWENYEEKIKKDWQEKVTEKDLVVLPGDFSWAMYLDETEKDFAYINSLPGKKILLKGNHDYLRPVFCFRRGRGMLHKMRAARLA